MIASRVTTEEMNNASHNAPMSPKELPTFGQITAAFLRIRIAEQHGLHAD
jgi:hypothetical protein